MVCAVAAASRVDFRCSAVQCGAVQCSERLCKTEYNVENKQTPLQTINKERLAMWAAAAARSPSQPNRDAVCNPGRQGAERPLRPQQDSFFQLRSASSLTLSLASRLRIICAKCAMVPVSTTVWASSGVCLQMSLSVEAAMRLRAISGSKRHNTSRGAAPASTTDWARAAR
ncbi:hypothetical protein AMECASPLE_000064 [Ameca splendens]|uniref:Uncharacterized protein n=1 Tax=Ameca splendens TaxID=208324 RepID=A0ABV0YVN9_9TELE